MIDDEGRSSQAKIARHEIGSDLSALSEHEIRARVSELQAEILRLEEEGRRKVAVREAAGAFFRPAAPRA